MPYIAPEVVQEAKRMDMLTYLKNYEPYELVHFSGNTYTTKTHDSLKISNGKWMWWSRGIGGRSAVDYLIKVRGLEGGTPLIPCRRVPASERNRAQQGSGSTHTVLKGVPGGWGSGAAP